MTTRYWEGYECEHGWLEPHVLPPDRRQRELGLDGRLCPGGQRRELTIKTEDFEIAAQAWDTFRAEVDITGADNFASAMGAESILRFFFTRVLVGAGLVDAANIPPEEPQAWTELEDGRLVLDPDGAISRGEEPADG